MAVAGLVVVLATILLTVLAPWVSPHDPNEKVASRLVGPGQEGLLLGADGQGRDVLSRLIYGGRVSLVVSAVPTAIAVAVGLALGMIAGYFGGMIDQVIMRVMEVFFAFPMILLAIAIAGVLGPGKTNQMVAITVVLIPYTTRVARTSTLTVRNQDYVLAARALGAPSSRILFHEIPANVLPGALIYGTTLVGLMIVAASGLSFLGLGVQPPAADWGVMVADGRTVLGRAPHVSTAPGVVIVVLALAFSFVGDGLRDALDPRSRSLAGTTPH
jgi:peptide/nickel transport system permease protein